MYLMRTTLALFAATLTLCAQAPKPKVLLIYDMEGLSGVNRQEQTSAASPEYRSVGRLRLTEDVNAAIRGLAAGGAGEIVVTDGHGSGNSEEPDILLDQLDKRARFEFRDRPFSQYIDMPDKTYQAIVCIGMHARAGTPGFLAHTFTIEPSWRVNGLDITETEIVAHSGARFGVPVIMVSGDDVLGKQLDERLPQVEYALVKRAKGRADADLLPLPEAHGNIESAARKAMQKLAQYKAYPVAREYRWEMSFQTPGQADRAANYPGLVRVNPTTLGYASSDFVSGYNIATRLVSLATSDRLNMLMEVVRKHPDGDKILADYRKLLNGRWLEPDRTAPFPQPAGGKRTRWWGAN
jgi:D-amino peptidase